MGSAERSLSGIPSAAIIRSQHFNQFQLILLSQSSVGPRSSGEVAQQHAGAWSNQRFMNSFLCLNLFSAKRQPYVHICGFNDPKLSDGGAWHGNCVVERSEGIRTTKKGGSE